MPTKVQGFECDVCGTIYTGIDALEKAKRCEDSGGKPQPKFEIGKEVVLVLGHTTNAKQKGAEIKHRTVMRLDSGKHAYFYKIWIPDENRFFSRAGSIWLSEQDVAFLIAYSFQD